MKPILADLLQLLELERIEDNIFRGESRDIGGERVFGGQVLGQALAAASYTHRLAASAFAARVLPVARRRRTRRLSTRWTSQPRRQELQHAARRRD